MTGKNAINIIELLDEALMYKEASPEMFEVAFRKFDVKKLNKAEKESWHLLYGVTAYQAGKRDDAFARFKKAFQACPRSGKIAFSLGQEYEYRGNIKETLRCFDKARYPGVTGHHILTKSRYCYLWDEYEKAIAYLNELFSSGAYDTVYEEMEHYLGIRHFPWYSALLGHLASLCILTDNLNEFLLFLTKNPSFASFYKDSDLEFYIECYRKKNFNPLIKDLKSAIAQKKRMDEPSGYHEMRCAVLEAQNASDPEKAEKILASVELKVTDSDWLEDMRTLALGDLMYRTSDFSTEKKLQKSFLKKQPLLLEPEIVIHFNLLQYQERLKKLYRDGKRKNRRNSRKGS